MGRIRNGPEGGGGSVRKGSGKRDAKNCVFPNT